MCIRKEVEQAAQYGLGVVHTWAGSLAEAAEEQCLGLCASQFRRRFHEICRPPVDVLPTNRLLLFKYLLPGHNLYQHFINPHSDEMMSIHIGMPKFGRALLML